MHLVVYGPEGSGKGTQAKLLGESLELPVYTTGDLVREAASNDKGEIGIRAQKVLLEGKYLPDEDVCSLLRSKLEGCDAIKGFVLDGFPRTLGQAHFLMEVLAKNDLKLDKLVYLKLSTVESVNRLLKRKRKVFGSSNILHDDPKRVKQRLSIYHKEEKDILQFFKSKDLLLEIDGNQPIEKVFTDILKGLKVDA